MMDKRVLAFVLTAALAGSVAGCDTGGEETPAEDAGADVTDDDVAESDASDDDGGITGPRRAEVKHSFGKMTLEPGEEITPCGQWTLNNDEPIYVNTVTAGNDGGWHHSNWFAVPESYASGEDGYFDCDERGFGEIAAAINGTVLFAQSTQAREERQDLPDGVVIKIPPNYKIVGGLHLLNVSTRQIETDFRMQLDIIHPADVETVVTPFRLSYLDLEIPPKGESRFTGECNFAEKYEQNAGEPFDMKLYWVLPHYHELGNYFKLDIIGGERDGETLFELDGFNAEANGQTYNPPIDMTGATGFEFTCGYNNPRDETVGWGIGDQEMCVMLGFAESELMFDASVTGGNQVVGEQDGIVMNEGPCGVLPIRKNSAQGPPEDDEMTGEMYVPPTDPSDEDVQPIPECEDTPETAEPFAEPTLTTVKRDIFSVGCAFSACHDTSSPAANLNLTADDLHTELMEHEVLSPTEMPLVDPGNPEGSYLYELVSKCEPQAGDLSVSHMPKNSATLMRPENVAMLRDWIAEGAQDN
jgi:hypothetical protein